MNIAYLNRVLIYLQQELPENYRERIKLTGEKLIDNDTRYNQFQPGLRNLASGNHQQH